MPQGLNVDGSATHVNYAEKTAFRQKERHRLENGRKSPLFFHGKNGKMDAWRELKYLARIPPPLPSGGLVV